MPNDAVGAGVVQKVIAGAVISDPFAARLALPATAAEVAQFIAQRAAACVGADYSNLALLDASRVDRCASSTALARPRAHGPLHGRRDGRPLPDRRRPFVPGNRSGCLTSTRITSSSPRSWTTPSPQASVRLPRCRCTAPTARRSARSGSRGSQPTPFGAKLVDALRAVAHLCTETIERAERYDDEHELIVELQRRLLPDCLPSPASRPQPDTSRPAGRPRSAATGTRASAWARGSWPSSSAT